MNETEIYRFIYLSQNMILRHEFVQQYNFILFLFTGFFLSQHIFSLLTSFLYNSTSAGIFPFGFQTKKQTLALCESLLMV